MMLNRCQEHNIVVDETGKSKGDYSLEHCLRLFTQMETLEKENAWYCSQCKDHKQATKRIEIYKAPQYLIIHLKRFKSERSNYSARYRSSAKKLATQVRFPIVGLDMSKYVLGRAPDERLLYDLFAVTHHSGSTGGGHYTASCMNSHTKKWYVFNDSRVIPIGNEEDIVSNTAYVLFYRRRDINGTSNAN
eukprot:TRINITY_DN12810_c0_g2_i4.p1 TRINITY_DN12810_c0_g2~~TRINITY_DN12810_c0_g2_i4.p1  ORF type:complete len:190 (-),score=17.48 TRINITY_DN12810_c0_g2_i4:80-649(-)